MIKSLVDLKIIQGFKALTTIFNGDLTNSLVFTGFAFTTITSILIIILGNYLFKKFGNK
jgi:hypothetical protein